MFALKKVLGHSEPDLNLKYIREAECQKSMNPIIVLVEKTNKNPDAIFRMFMEEREILLKKLRSAIGKSSLYRLFSFRIDEINAIVKSIQPSLFFMERKSLRKNSRMLITYCVHPNCLIGESDSFFFLEFKPVSLPEERLPQLEVKP